MQRDTPIDSYEDFVVNDFAAYLAPAMQIPLGVNQMFPPGLTQGHEYNLSNFMPAIPSATHARPASAPHLTAVGSVRSPPDSDRAEKRRKTNVVNLDPEKILEKNRESARESRRRKKEYIKSLEEKVAKLQTELQELRDRFEVYSQQAFNETIDEKTTQLEELLKRPPQKKNEEELVQSITTIQNLHTEQLKSTLGHYLEKAEQMMQPFPFAKFILWGLDHDDAWFEADRVSGGGLWSAIIRELEISDEQQQQLFLLRPSSVKLKEEFLRLERSAASMRKDTTTQLAYLSEFLSKLRDVLTPPQQAKFFVWSQKNKGCMQLVHSLWVGNSK
eukprot:TRINITY_DN1781_c0_g1_i2.p1 TRINITY_DN1781_c0_g1~~TRINITY_DN1781_c0_g1_i2.p1  ORF type:complete len:331 (+),score=75.14 TRINITY_DN1781_c0_g1_i2:355-1347(+)